MPAREHEESAREMEFEMDGVRDKVWRGIGIQMARIRCFRLDLGNRCNICALGVGSEQLVKEHANMGRDKTVGSSEESKYSAVGSDIIRSPDAIDAVTTGSERAMEGEFEAVKSLSSGGVDVNAR